MFGNKAYFQQAHESAPVFQSLGAIIFSSSYFLSNMLMLSFFGNLMTFCFRHCLSASQEGR